MNAQAITTLAILAVALGLFVSDRLRADVVALLVAVSLGVTGVLSPRETFAGFGSPVVLTIVAIFILAEGLRLTRVTDRVAGLLVRLAGTGGRRLTVVVMAAGAFLSLFMNNTAAAALLLPAASKAGRRAGVSLSRLLMPLSFATLLGGMATLITTTNIVVSEMLQEQGYVGFGLLDFAPVGVPLVLIGTAYMALLGGKLLPESSPADHPLDPSAAPDLFEVYRLTERLVRALVPPGSPLSGKSLAESSFRQMCSADVVGIQRLGRLTLSPGPSAILREGDVLVLEAKPSEMQSAEQAGCVKLLADEEWDGRTLASETVVMAEAVLSPRSSLIGQTLQGAHFREKYGMTVLALWRAGRPIRTGIRRLELEFGDALLLQGPRNRLAVLSSEPDLIVLSAMEPEPSRLPAKGRLAFGIMVATVIVVGLGKTSLGVTMMAGALAMILAGVLTVDQAYQAVEWRTFFLVAGMLPVSTAIVKSGSAGVLASAVVGALGSAGPGALLAGILVVSALLAQAMNGTAVAFLMFPVAVRVAEATGVDPRSLAMAVVLGTSMAFLTPLGHPVNLLVMGSGGYRFADYAKVGLPLLVALLAMVVFLLPLFWPLGGGV